MQLLGAKQTPGSPLNHAEAAPTVALILPQPPPRLLFLLMCCAFKALPRSSRAARAPAGCQGAHSSHHWLMAATRRWGDEGAALPLSAARLDLGGRGGGNTRTFPCMSSRMVSVTFNPPSMTPVSILGCVGSGQALSAVRSLVAG